MIPHTPTPARRTLTARPHMAVENDNGACCCNGRDHIWASGDCDAHARGER